MIHVYVDRRDPLMRFLSVYVVEEVDGDQWLLTPDEDGRVKRHRYGDTPLADTALRVVERASFTLDQSVADALTEALVRYVRPSAISNPAMAEALTRESKRVDGLIETVSRIAAAGVREATA